MAHMPLPHTMTVERLAATTSKKEGYQDRPGSIACFLQPAMDAETDTGNGSTFTKANRCFIDYTSDVRTKDRVEIGGQKYNVSGMTEHAYGTWPHKVLTLQSI